MDVVRLLESKIGNVTLCMEYYFNRFYSLASEGTLWRGCCFWCGYTAGLVFFVAVQLRHFELATCCACVQGFWLDWLG